MMGQLVRLLSLAGIGALTAAGAQAQDFPSHPISLVVPFSAGSGIDPTARIIADELGKALKQPVDAIYINGGGWSVTGPGAPSAIAVKLDVPWDRANQRLHLRLRLIGQDGEPVTIPGPQGPQPIQITADA